MLYGQLNSTDIGKKKMSLFNRIRNYEVGPVVGNSISFTLCALLLGAHILFSPPLPSPGIQEMKVNMGGVERDVRVVKGSVGDETIFVQYDGDFRRLEDIYEMEKDKILKNAHSREYRK